MWGGGRAKTTSFFKAEAGCGGNGFVGLVRMPCFRGLPFFPQNGGSKWIFPFFLVRAKSKNTVIYRGFVSQAWKKYILQGAENCVNTSVFARRWPKHRKYRGFVLPRRHKHWYSQCFVLGECPKSVKSQPI